MWREPGEGRQDWHLIKYLYRDNPNLSLPSTGWRHRKWFSWQDSQKISHQILNVISGRQEVIVIRRAGGAHEIILIWRNDLLLTSQPALSREDCPQCSVDDWWPDVSWVWPGVTSQDNTPAPHSTHSGLNSIYHSSPPSPPPPPTWPGISREIVSVLPSLSTTLFVLRPFWIEDWGEKNWSFLVQSIFWMKLPNMKD